MKKIVCFGLCFLLVLCSFVLSFADFSPQIMPRGTEGGLSVPLSNGNTYYYSSNNYPTYVIWYKNPSSSSYTCVYFSDQSDTLVYRQYNDGAPASSSLSSEYNGFYYSYNSSSVHPNDGLIFYPDEDLTVTELIDYVDHTVFSTSFDLSYITDGAVSWLSALVDGVMQEPLLMFLILFSFIGVGVGLLFRFRRG